MTGIRVDLRSPTPVYEQIRSQVAGLVAVGDLAPGDRLPASRTLAHDLGIAVGTVQRAYRELEQSGVVVSRRRTGTVVAGTPDAGHGALVRSVRALVDRARADGLDDAAILDLVRAVLRDR
ncbi:GntR family transcriptional regulator [Isoptericola jiangsuensis]|uniref:GntR family transcriptional regulator n=1 Tax=Isoptericola jiangsuensis TaxID=548579 RepID=A0A2A9EZK9_9MICO|nr:GntR family transcriptional regulator [Isoptericola jiangsuensis]PFG44308.1 GntR family transcriptional regulator [Isoptericola jiangsuensis]